MINISTNHYFNNYNAKYTDQRLIENLIVESIKIMGFDAYYLPNYNDFARDLLYGEDPLRSFPAAFPVEMYLQNAEGYIGDKDFFSKFGLEIRNNINVVISKRSFEERVQVNDQIEQLIRPREGDLVYVPVLNGVGELYEIKFVDQDPEMSQLGRRYPYFYELQLEKFKYSQENIDTGIPEIDTVVNDSAYTIHFNMGNGSGNYIPNEIVYQSPDGTYTNATSLATVQSWLPESSVLSVDRIVGEFSTDTVVLGYDSGSSYILLDYDFMFDPAAKENYDNQYIYQQANLIIDFSESNPFGPI